MYFQKVISKKNFILLSLHNVSIQIGNLNSVVDLDLDPVDLYLTGLLEPDPYFWYRINQRFKEI
jgi:hypothetical protein